MVVIPGPVEFMMGSPATETGRLETEPGHMVRIRRTFAVAAKAVTFEQYRKYHSDYNVGAELRQYTRMPNLPVIGTNWYQAAAYCNWLSEKEGISKNQWSYEIKDDDVQKLQQGKRVPMRLRDNYLSLTGYRLPTEAEMEYATRAGALTSRYHGETDDLLDKYAWYSDNSDQKTWPIGLKKPNDFGFFDMQGNIWCWCQDRYGDYPESKGEAPAEDTEQLLDIASTDDRVLRGGSFALQASWVRCACRNFYVPTLRSNLGFRAARTLPVAPLAALPLPAPAPKLELRVDVAGWDADPDSVAALLKSAGHELTQFFPGSALPPVHVSHGVGPITLFQREPDGAIAMRLSASGQHWAQYAYQFAHETCHVLCGMRGGPSQSVG